MGSTTKIEWTSATWNPVRGCAVVSPGCTNCYAMKLAHRFSGKGKPYAGLTKMTKGGPVWTGEVRTVPELLYWPLRKKKPMRIFVNSMSDLFHEDVDAAFIDRVFAVMALSPQHTFQVLTKRPQRMRDYMLHPLRRQRMAGAVMPISNMLALKHRTHKARIKMADFERAFPPGDAPPWPNVWLGVSVEDQARADERIPLLLQTPAAVRWISAEPLLGPVSLTRWTGPHPTWPIPEFGPWLNWVVVGGESGPGARPMHPDWARSLRDQCAAAGVPYFFKQWGAWMPAEDYLRTGDTTIGHRTTAGFVKVGKSRAGRILDGRTHDEYPR